MHINTLTGAYFGSQQKNFTGKVFLKAIERFWSRLIVRISFAFGPMGLGETFDLKSNC